MKTLIIIVICVVIFYVLPLIYCIRNLREYENDLWQKKSGGMYGEWEMSPLDVFFTICPWFNFFMALIILVHKFVKFIHQHTNISKYINPERFFK